VQAPDYAWRMEPTKSAACEAKKLSREQRALPPPGRLLDTRTGESRSAMPLDPEDRARDGPWDFTFDNSSGTPAIANGADGAPHGHVRDKE
jgi:hypothetical protein